MSQKQAITKTKGKICIKSKTDSISELPDEILSSIFSYFTVRDAANASVLSSRWRHLSDYMSDLNFDLSSMFLPHEDAYAVFRGNGGKCRQFKDIFVRGVNQFLQFYKGSRLRRFKVSFCLEENSTYDINQWIIFAASMGVEDLSLNFSCRYCAAFDKPCHMNLYTVHSELFSQYNVSKVLKLQLRECILGPGVINQFGSLISLFLANVKLGAHEVESILSCCLNVESITFATCTLIPVLCIPGSLHRLKHLCVMNCPEVEEIELSATNLSRLEVDGDSIKVSFSRARNLKQIFFRAIRRREMQYVFSQFAKDLPLVETLSVYTECDWVQNLPEQITTFNKVKQLEFYSPRNIKLDLSKIISILKACPLMEKFHLVMYSVYPEEEIPGLTLPLECVHKYLKEIHIGGFHFKASYVEFALYLLEYGVALERMVVDPKFEFYYGFDLVWRSSRIAWDKGERAKVCSQLQDHPKSSVIIIR